MRAIDLNADLGETVDGAPTADDDAMFAVISSASIACGGHSGDAVSMATSVARAIATGTAVGAHPSYVDRAGFGRTRVAVSPAALTDQLSAQLAALESAGADIRYVKPHGALYHAAGADSEVAAAVVAAVSELADRVGRGIPILGLGARLEEAAMAAGVPFVGEAFLDRGYRSDGSLVPRGEPGALLHDPAVVADRAMRLVRDGAVEAVDGSLVRVDAASLCLHGDSPDAVAMAVAVRRALDAAAVAVRAPW